MFPQSLTAILSTFLLVSPIVLATSIRRATLDTAEIYYLSNCFNQSNPAIQWAEVDYYADSSFSGDGQAPDLVGSVNLHESVDYEDGTWFVFEPFRFTVFIGDDASTDPAGSIVGNANSSTFAGPMNCVRLTRIVLYDPEVDVECFSDYACIDVSLFSYYSCGRQ